MQLEEASVTYDAASDGSVVETIYGVSPPLVSDIAFEEVKVKVK